MNIEEIIKLTQEEFDNDSIYLNFTLSWLLNQGRIIFVNDGLDNSITLDVECSDVFAWGCSDCEPLPFDEVLHLAKLVYQYNDDGAVIWCCLRRNQQPQAPVISMMKKAKTWIPDLEALPENRYDLARKNARKNKDEDAHSSIE